jgi:hypothetical protein
MLFEVAEHLAGVSRTLGNLSDGFALGSVLTDNGVVRHNRIKVWFLI